MIKVSVIVPCHNAERTIEQCIMSAVEQDFPNEFYEVIVIDDGSTDGSASVIKSIAELYPDLIRFYQTPDNGQASTMNYGLHLAEGEYVCELDADDWYEPNALSLLYSNASLNYCDAVQCSFFAEMNDGTTSISRVIGESHCGCVYNPKYLVVSKLPIVFGRIVSLWAGIYRRQFLIDNGVFWRSGFNFEDTAVAFKIRAHAERFMMLHDAVYHHRVDYAGSGSATIRDKVAIFDQFDEVFRVADELHLQIDSYLSVWMFYTFSWAYGRLDNDDDREEFLNRASGYFQRHRPLPIFFNCVDDYSMFEEICYRTLPQGK